MAMTQKTNSSKRARNKIPMNEETLNEMIRKKAYELHEQRGGEHGRDFEDWLEAERIVKAEMRKSKK